MQVRRRLTGFGCALAAAIGLFFTTATPSLALEKIVFLLPAPPSLPAFAPLIIAKQLGYYAQAGYDLQFLTARGGVDVAKQVGVGNADLGLSVGGAPIIVRANGVPIKDVAVLGGGGLGVIVARSDHGVKSLADLRGKKVAVMSYEEANYYDFLGALAARGINKTDIKIEAVGPQGMVSLPVAGAVDACVCTPDWEVDIKNALPSAVAMPLTEFVPTVAQAIIASDAGVASHPKRIRAVVQASIKGLVYVMKDPAEAAKVYARALPSFAGKEALMTQILKAYVERTYAGQKIPGEVDPAKLAALQSLYLKEGIVRTAQPLDTLYTNAFVDPVPANKGSGR